MSDNSELPEVGIGYRPGQNPPMGAGVRRTWSMPTEPGPEVTAVRTADGCVFDHDDHPERPWVDHYDDSDHYDSPSQRYRLEWGELVKRYGPLTDATGEDLDASDTP